MSVERRLIPALALLFATTVYAQVPIKLQGTWVITSAEARKLPAGAHVAMEGR